MIATKVFRSVQPLKNVSTLPSQSLMPSRTPQWLLAKHLPLPPLTLTIRTSTEHPPLRLHPQPRQYRQLQQRHLRPHRRRRLVRRRILLLPNHGTQTRSASSPISRRTQNRPLIPRSLGLGASKSLPGRRPRFHRPQARIRRGNQPQYEKIPLRAPEQR